MSKRTGPERTRPSAVPALGRLTASVEPLIVGSRPPAAEAAPPDEVDVRDPAPTSAVSANLVPVDQVAPNPLNERTDYSEVAEIAADIRERGQMDACAVVDRGAFLKIWPAGETAEVNGEVIEPAAAIGSAEFIVVSGSTRRLAVIENGASLPPGESAMLRIDVQNHLAKSQLDFLLGTWAGNARRKNPNPIEDARLIARIAAKVGSATAAGRILGFKNPQVETSQRLALLGLSRQMQDLIENGTIPYRVARALAPKLRKLTPEQQLALWKAEERKRLAAAGANEGGQDGESADEPNQAAAKPRRFILTEHQPVQEVAATIRQLFAGAELRALIEALGEEAP
jgi:hypothetical protein